MKIGGSNSPCTKRQNTKAGTLVTKVMIKVGTTTANMAAVIRRFLPDHVGERPGKRRGQRNRPGAGRHQPGDVAGTDAKLLRQGGQERLHRIEIDEGAEAGRCHGQAAGVEGHAALCGSRGTKARLRRRPLTAPRGKENAFLKLQSY